MREYMTGICVTSNVRPVGQNDTPMSLGGKEGGAIGEILQLA